jgi:hypothetical protein
MKAALYVRTSTNDQTTENQERELRAVAARLGHEIVEVYADNGISGGGIGGRPLIVYAATRPAGGSTSSWPGRSIGSGAPCRIWSDS